MDKRLLALTLCFALLVLLIPDQVHAAGQEGLEIIPLGDGYHLEVATTSMETRGTATKGGTKTYTMYNSSHDALWQVRVYGLFQYNGISSECVESDCTVTIHDEAWFVSSESTTYSGSTAYATVVLKLRELGIVTRTETCNVSVSCDKDGNIS